MNEWWRGLAAVSAVVVVVIAAVQTSAKVDRDAPCSVKQMSEPQALSPADRAELLKVRDGVWYAWFSGNDAALRKVLPSETIVSGDQGWTTRDGTIKSSLEFAKNGGRLTKLEFPTTEIQSYGATAILYTTYVYEIESGGKRSSEKGTALEVFVRRADGWVHTGWQLRAEPVVGRSS
jgi:hypothetical protein